MGKTMPQTVPKAAKGDTAPGYSAKRLGTIKFSTVEIPVRRSSARARGMAVCIRRLRIGKRGAVCGFSRSRSITRLLRVRQAPMPLPRITA